MAPKYTVVQLPPLKDSGSRSTCLFASHLSYLESEKNSEKETLLKAQSMEKTKVKEKFLQQVRTINPDSFFINISIHCVSFGGTPELWKWHDEQ